MFHLRKLTLSNSPRLNNYRVNGALPMIGVSTVRPRDSIQFTRIFPMQRKDGAKEENSEVIEISI